MVTRSALLSVLLLGVALCSASAQGTKADYDRAAAVKGSGGKIYGVPLEVHWLPGGDSFWYRVETAQGKFEKVFVDCVKGERRAGFVPPENTGQPGKLEKVRSSRASDVETSITFVNDTDSEAICWWIGMDGKKRRYATLQPSARSVQHTFAGHVWVVESTAGQRLGIFEARAGGGDARVDGTRKNSDTGAEKKHTADPWEGFIREHNAWIRNRTTGEEVRLSSDGQKDDAFREPVLVSPDGAHAVVMRVQPEQEHRVHLIESSPKDQVEPKLHSHQYLKPGDRIRKERPVLFDLTTRQSITVDDALFAKPWDLSDLRWQPEGDAFTFLYNERGHQVLRVISVAAKSGAPRVLVEEKAETFVDYSQKTWFRWLAATDELLWMSERDGWNHLYLFDSKNGALKNRITTGEWVVRGVPSVDEGTRQIFLRVAGVKPAQDPYYIQFARVNFDGSGFTLLTDGDGTHSAIGENGKTEFALSPNGRWLVDTYSRVDLPPVTELRDARSGALVCVLDEADATQWSEAGWTVPERFTAKGRDGTTDIFGVIIKPSHFDPSKKYPVVEQIYAGPHGFFVPKEWSRMGGQHAIAELGFIVVQIDGMGTNWRSRAFHDVAWRSLNSETAR